MEGNKLSIRGALLWSFAERYTSLIATVASTMILARLLTPAQVGVFSLCAAVAAVASILRDFGISEYLIQEKQLTREKLQAAMALAMITAWSIAAGILLCRTAIADYYAEPGVSEVLAVLCINFFILPFGSPAFALLNRELAFRKVYAVQTISGLASAITSVSLAYLGYGFMSLAWGTVVNISCQNVILAFLRPRDSLVMPNLKEARTVLRYGSMYVASRVIETISNNSHEFIIAKKLGFDTVGLFSRALGLLELFYTNFTSAILRVTTPIFASDHRGGGDLPARYATSTAMITVIAWPFYGYVALMANDIISVLFGHQWAAAAPIASVLALTRLPGNLTTLGPSFLAATGHVKKRLKLTLISAPVHIVAVLIASHWGPVAIAAAFGLSSLVSVFIYLKLLPRLMNCRISELFAGSGKSVVVAVVCVAAQFVAQEVCHANQLNSLVSLVIVGLMAAISWLVAISILKHDMYFELLRLRDFKASILGRRDT